jgi:hypothetical protein
MEPAFASDRPIYVLEPRCISADSVTVPITIGTINAQKGRSCIGQPAIPPNNDKINILWMNHHCIGLSILERFRGIFIIKLADLVSPFMKRNTYL